MPRGNQNKKHGLTEQIVLRVTPELKAQLSATAEAAQRDAEQRGLHMPVTPSDIARFILTAHFTANPDGGIAYKE
jgi:hypothetical protein